jgi:hypothetical protein
VDLEGSDSRRELWEGDDHGELARAIDRAVGDHERRDRGDQGTREVKQEKRLAVKPITLKTRSPGLPA